MSVPLLHNMSARPRTQVRAWLLPLGRTVCRFALADAGETVERVLADPGWPERLDGAWARYRLRGACHIYPWREGMAVSRRRAPVEPGLVPAGDPLLVLNVLGRTRSQLLLGSAPLVLERAFLERELASDDARLVALAEETR